MNSIKNNLFSIITVLSIIFLFIILQPKASALLFNIRKTAILDTFIANTIKNKSIDVQEFWKMREFYCPGSFTFDKTKNPFLEYTCKWMKSNDYLSTTPALTLKETSGKKNVIFKNDSIYIYRDNKQMTIIFSVDESHMKKAIGYFDYGEKDKQLVKGKFWHDETFINL